MGSIEKSDEVIRTPKVDLHRGVTNTESSGCATVVQQMNWRDAFRVSTITAPDLQKLEVEPRKRIMGEWFQEGDLGFIFGPRGQGKTWWSMEIAHAIAEGRNLGPWQCSGPCPVLYTDGEMALDATRTRDAALTKSAAAELHYLHHQLCFDKTGKVLNLADLDAQDAFAEFIIQSGFKVVFLDNLSCLFAGVKENDADAWELVLPWLLKLRRCGISVVIVAHASRTGTMRGTSRREDAAHWIVQIKPVESDSEKQGARFVTQFTKNRNATDAEVQPLEWLFEKLEGGGVQIRYKPQSQLARFRELIAAGFTTATEVASHLEVSASRVSQLASQAKKEGWLFMKGRQYAISDAEPAPAPVGLAMQDVPEETE